MNQTPPRAVIRSDPKSTARRITRRKVRPACWIARPWPGRSGPGRAGRPRCPPRSRRRPGAAPPPGPPGGRGPTRRRIAQRASDDRGHQRGHERPEDEARREQLHGRDRPRLEHLHPVQIRSQVDPQTAGERRRPPAARALRELLDAVVEALRLRFRLRPQRPLRPRASPAPGAAAVPSAATRSHRPGRSFMSQGTRRAAAVRSPWNAARPPWPRRTRASRRVAARCVARHALKRPTGSRATASKSWISAATLAGRSSGRRRREPPPPPPTPRPRRASSIALWRQDARRDAEARAVAGSNQTERRAASSPPRTCSITAACRVHVVTRPSPSEGERHDQPHQPERPHE